MTTIQHLSEIIETIRSLSDKKSKLEYLNTLDRDVLNFLAKNIKMDNIGKAIASEIPISSVTKSSMEDIVTIFSETSLYSRKKNKVRGMNRIILNEEDRELVLTILYGSLKLGLKVPIPEPEFDETIKPMLCNSGIEFNPIEMVIEHKWDGIRCVATNNNGIISLQSRNGKVLNIPVIERSLLDVLPRGTTVDGEIIDKSGDFGKLKREGNNIYQIFDIIFKDSQPLINLLLKDRLVILNDLIIENEYIKISQELNLNSMIDIDNWIVKTGAEGVVVKNPNSLYQYGNRKDWIKYKLFKECTAKVVGYTLGEGRRSGTIGAINIIPENSDVLSKCGSGFKDSDLDYMKELIDNDDDILVNIKYQNLTNDGCLRFPIFMNIRSINGKESLD